MYGCDATGIYSESSHSDPVHTALTLNKNITLHENDHQYGKHNVNDTLSGTCISVDPSITISQIRNVKISILEMGNLLVSIHENLHCCMDADIPDVRTKESRSPGHCLCVRLL